MKNKIFGEEITSVAERMPKFVSTFPPVLLPPNGKLSLEQLFSEENYYRQNFFVDRDILDPVSIMVKIAWDFYDRGLYDESNEIVEALLPHSKSLEDNPKDIWKHMAFQMPGDLGICMEVRPFFQRKVSALCTEGKILEAFAGYTSYVEPTGLNEVIATDGCSEALERYQYPDRKRILFDMDMLNGKNQIGDFADESFDAVTVTTGYKYPKRIMPVLREFFRILKCGGQVIFLEHSYAGYEHVVRREFDPKQFDHNMRNAGFEQTQFDIEPGFADDKYYIAKSKKPER